MIPVSWWRRVLFRNLLPPFLTVLVSGCTTPNPDYCDEDKLCTDPDRGYCDIAGDFGPANTCIPDPFPDAGPSFDAATILHTLAIVTEGDGRVVSSPTGIDCGAQCEATFAAGTVVTLTATPEPGSRLVSWAGGCAGSAPTCQLVVDADVTVTATFDAIKAIQVDAGYSHTCVLLDTGGVRCWGYNLFGQLGYGNTDNVGDDEIPGSVGDVDIGGTATQVAVGGEHTCALLDSGAVRCWGHSSFGQLGYASTDAIGDDEHPSTAGDIDVGGKVVQISAGFLHTCALLDTGAVRCWGNSSYGQLGYGNTDTIGDNETPASAGDVNVGGTVTQVTAGFQHTCALLDTGAVRCWGNGVAGQLGYGNTTTIGDDEAPASAGDVDIGGDSTQITVALGHTCARRDTGAVYCWGGSPNGQLGYGNTVSIGDDELPASAGYVNVSGVTLQLDTGGEHTCARRDTRDVRCWGNGEWGQLGYGNTDNIGDDETPNTAGSVDVGGDVAQIATGYDHTCALLVGGTVRCWGRNSSGRLGYGNTDAIGDDETPASAGDVPLF